MNEGGGAVFAKTQGLFCKSIPFIQTLFPKFCIVFSQRFFSVFMTRTTESGVGGEGAVGRSIQKYFSFKQFSVHE